MLFVTQSFLEDMALVLAIAAVATIICQFLRQPVVLGYLVAGMAVGPHIPGFYADVRQMREVAELGVTLLIFAIGLEFKLRRLMRLAPTAGLVALAQIAAMVGLGYLVGRLMGWTAWQSLLAGAVASISGAVVIAKAFEETPVDPRVRELVFGVVLCEDVIAIFMLAVLITLASGRELSFLELSTKVRLLGAFVVLLLAIGIFTVPRLLRGAARFRRKETLLITSLGLCFALAVLAERAGYSVALGAFLAGSLVAESGLGEEVEKLIEPVKQVFGAVFFVAVGMLIDPEELAAHWAALVLLVGVVVIGKIVAVTLASLAIGERPEVAVKCGFAMGQIGVFSLLIAEIGTKSDAMSGFLYTLAAGSCAITMFLCPRLIRLSNPAADWVGRHLPMPIEGALTRYNRWLHPSRKAPEAKG